MLLEGIGDLATSWRIKGPSSIIFSQAKSFGLCCFIVYPMILLAVTCAYIIYTLKVACTLECVRFCTLPSVCMCCALYLLILRNQVCVCWFAHHLLVLSLIAFYLLYYLVGSLWEINGLFLFGRVISFVHFTILKMCIHEEYPLVMIYHYYLLSIWYVILMRNSNSIMSINYI